MPEQKNSQTDYQDKIRRDTYLPESPDTPVFGPPSGETGTGTEYLPESPDTPTFGPPPGEQNNMPANPSPFQPYPFPTPALPGGNHGGSQGNGSQGGTNGGMTGGIGVTGGIWPVIPGWPNVSPSRPGETNRQGYCTLRFLHAAVGQPAVRISIGSKPLVPQLSYGEVSSYFIETDGFKRINISSVGNGRVAVYQEIFLFFDGDVYTIAIVNSRSGIALFPVNDAPCSNSRQNFSCVRAANLSYNAPALDVALTDGMVRFDDLRFRNVSTYKQIMRGYREFYVSESESGAMVLTEEKQIEPGRMYTMYLLGDAYVYPGIQAVFTEDYPEM